MVNTNAFADPHRATNRVLDVLEHLAATGQTTTLAALSGGLAVPKSSLLPLLRTLVARGWLQQLPTGSYRIAPDRLSSGRVDLPAVARPFLARLTAETGESSFLGVLPPGSDAVIYMEKVESPHHIRYSAAIGERRPVHCTAVGMAVMAFLPKERQESILRKTKFTKLTPHTSVDRAEIARRLARVSKAGVVCTFEEFVVGAAAIAAPVYNRSGEVAAACTLAGPADRMRAGRERYTDAVKSTALAISAALGWRPNGPARNADE